MNVVTMLMRSGMGHFTHGRFVEAEGLFRQVVAADANHANALHLLGIIACKKGQVARGAELMEKSIQLDASNVGWHVNLGEARLTLQQFDKAAESFQAALEMGAENARVEPLLGAALLNGRRFTEARGYLERAARAAPADAEAQSQQGVVLGMLQERAGALASFRRAYELSPKSAKHAALLGNALVKFGHAEESIGFIEKALAIEPKNELARLDYGMALLTLGRFTEGWAAYESRPSRTRMPRDSYRRLLWDGRKVGSVLLLGEQGFGDVLQFVRYAPLVEAKGIRVEVACRKPLMRLVAGVAGVSRVHDVKEPLSACDGHQFLLGLPRLFGTEEATIPRQVPYVFADPATHARWAEKMLQTAGINLRVGMVWAGSQVHENDANRSLSLDLLKPVLGCKGVTFFSVQLGEGANALAAYPSIIDLTPGITDFADTAGLVANLDLVICVDTAAAHLAGAMGKAVWVMLPFAPDWRWMLKREDSPWYPTMRLFRQQVAGNWAPVIERVAAELRETARARG